MSSTTCSSKTCPQCQCGNGKTWHRFVKFLFYRVKSQRFLHFGRVPGVLIICIRESRFAVFVSEERPNFAGVHCFMRLHGISPREYSCEVLATARLPNRDGEQGQLGRTRSGLAAVQ